MPQTFFGPLDVLGGAVLALVDEYLTAFPRRPTAAEWEALLTAVLGIETPDQRALDNGIVKRVFVEGG